MDPKQVEQLKIELAKREEQFKEAVFKTDEILKETHTRKEYTFSTTEKRRLLQQQSIQIFVEQAISDIINMSVLPRLSIVSNDQTKIVYDISLGKFIIWAPKLPPEKVPEKTESDLSEQPLDDSQ